MASKKPAAKPAEAAAGESAPAKVHDHPNVSAAKLAVTRQVGVLQRRAAPEGGYSYIPEDEVVDRARAAMIEHGLSLTPVSVRVIHCRPYQSPGGPSFMVAVEVGYRLTHAASGTNEDGASAGQGCDAADRAVGMAMTRALIHYLRQAFLLRSGYDPDRREPKPAAEKPAEAKPEPATAKPVAEPPAERREAARQAQATAQSEFTELPPTPHAGNGKASHRQGEPGAKNPPPQIDPRPPSERPPVPQETFDATALVIKNAGSQPSLDRYRELYTKHRNFNQEQIDAFDRMYRERTNELAQLN